MTTGLLMLLAYTAGGVMGFALCAAMVIAKDADREWSGQ